MSSTNRFDRMPQPGTSPSTLAPQPMIRDFPGLGPMPLDQALRQFKWTLLAIVLLSVGAGYLYTLSQPTVYETEARVLLSPPGSGVFSTPNEIDPERHLRNEVERFRSTRIQADARSAMMAAASTDPDLRVDAEEFGQDFLPQNAVEFDKRVQVQPALDIDLITITATGPTAEVAALAANSLIEAYQAVVTERAEAAAARIDTELQEYETTLTADRAALQAELDGIRAIIQADIAAIPVDSFNPVDPFLELQRRLAIDPSYTTLENQRNGLIEELAGVQTQQRELAVDRQSLDQTGVDFVEPAPIPGVPSGPRRLVNLLVSVLVGLILGLIAVAIRANAFDRVTSSQTMQRVLGIPHLSDIPRSLGLLFGRASVLGRPGSHASDALQALAGVVSLRMAKSGAAVVAVTSPRPRDGKTTIVLNLALALAADGRSVALVDADHRSRELTKLIGADPEVGLRQVAMSATATDDVLDLAVTLPSANHNGVRFFPPGEPGADPVSFLRSSRFKEAFDIIRAHSDVVLIDTAPVLASAEIMALAPTIDAVLVVARDGTRERHLEATGSRLAVLDVPALGFVRNRVRRRAQASRTRAKRRFRLRPTLVNAPVNPKSAANSRRPRPRTVSSGGDKGEVRQ